MLIICDAPSSGRSGCGIGAAAQGTRRGAPICVDNNISLLHIYLDLNHVVALLTGWCSRGISPTA